MALWRDIEAKRRAISFENFLPPNILSTLACRTYGRDNKTGYFNFSDDLFQSQAVKPHKFVHTQFAACLQRRTIVVKH